MLLSNVGYRSAYYSGVMLNFCNEETNQPENSIIWLANQGGKTTLISLLFTNIEPAKRRFVQHLQKPDHHFEDYFYSSPGVVALELKVAGADLTGESASLIIGQCVVVPASGGGTQRVYFGFSSNDKLGLENLPFSGADSSTKMASMADFRHWLDQANQKNSTVYSIENQGEWKKWLDSQGVEHDLLAKQIDFCRSEGGISDFASFKDEKTFLEQFLMLALDEPKAQQAHTILRQAHEQYKSMPKLETKLVIYSELLKGFQEIEIPAAKYQSITKEVVEHDQQLLIQLQIIQSRQQWLNLEEEKLQENTKKLTVKRELNQTNLLTAHHNFKRTKLSLLVRKSTDASETLKHEQKESGLSEDYLGLLIGVAAWGALQKVRIEHDDLTRTINEANEDIAPKEKELRNLGSELALNYSALIEQQSRSVSENNAHITKLEKEIEENEALKVTSQKELDRQRSTRDKATQWLESYDQQYRILSEKGCLQNIGGEQLDVIQAEAYWQQQYNQQVEYAENNQKEQTRKRTNQGEKYTIISSQKADIAKAEVQLEQLKKDLNEALKEKDELTSSPILCKLINMGSANPNDLSLLEKLEQKTTSLQRAFREKEQRVNELTIQKDRLKRDQLAKPDENAERALEWLDEQGISALYYPRYISQQNLTIDEARELVESDPARFYGLQVNNLSKLQSSLGAINREKLNLTQPIVISEGCNQVEHTQDHLVLPSRNDAAYNEEAAKSLLITLTSELENLTEALAATGKEKEEHESMKDQLKSYQKRYGKQWLDSQERLVFDKEKELNEAKQTLEGINEDLVALELELEALSKEFKTISADQNTAQSYYNTLNDFVNGYERDKIRKADEEKSALEAIQQLDEKLVDIQKTYNALKAQSEETMRTLSKLRKTIEKANSSLGEISFKHEDSLVSEPDIKSIPNFKAKYDASEANYKILLSEKGLEELKGKLSSLTTNLSEKQESFRKSKGIHAEEKVSKEADRINAEALDLSALISDQRAKVTAHDRNIGKYQSLVDGAEKNLQAYQEKSPNLAALDEKLSLLELERSLKELEFTIGSGEQAEKEFNIEHQTLKESLNGYVTESDGINMSMKLVPQEAIDKSIQSSDDLSSADQVQYKAVFEIISGLLSTKKKLAVDQEKIKSEVYHHFKRSILPIAENPEKAALLGALATDIKLCSDQQLIDRSESHSLTMKDGLDTVESQININKDKLEFVNSSFSRLLDDADDAIYNAFKVRIPEDMMHYSGKAILKSKLSSKNRLRITLSESQRKSIFHEHIKSTVYSQSIDEDGYKLATNFLLKSYEIVLGAATTRTKSDLLNIQIIKPHDVEVGYIPVNKMIGSGGEGLTAGLLLYLVIANIRGESVGKGQVGKSGGFLLLDNPFSKANKVDLIRPQTQLAKKLNIQLIFATGIEDLNAIGEFEHIIRLRKDRMDANSKRQYIEHEQPYENVSSDEGNNFDKYRIQAVDYSYGHSVKAQEN